MGVDYYSCNYCGETFCDCGYFVSCECGNRWCCDECAEEDGFIENEETEERSCKYCRNEDFYDEELLEYALKLLNKTREELLEEFKKL